MSSANAPSNPSSNPPPNPLNPSGSDDASLALASVIEQVRGLRTGDYTPLELTELYLKRIEQFDPQLGSYFHVAAEQARAEAQQKTEQLTLARHRNETLPDLFGIPISIKDLNAVAEMPVSYGVAALRSQVPPQDDGSVLRLKQNGTIILGKSALSQLASWPYSEPPGFPPSRNPWNLDHTSGGSSGGAAAAVAAGLCSLAHGSDGGGSIRGPAFCCGVVGIKPSRGRVSAAPLGESLGGLATQGPLGRSVADAAALLDAMAGQILGDPHWLPDPPIPFVQMAQSGAQALPAEIKVAFATHLVGFPPASDACQTSVQRAIEALVAGGAIAEEISLDLRPLIDPFTQVWLSAVAAAGLPRAILEPMNQWLLDRAPTSAQYIQAQQTLQVAARGYVQQLAPYDAVILPTYLAPAIPVGAWQHLDPETVMERIAQWIAPCPLANVTGQPAIALPTHLAAPEATPNSPSLPVGIQLLGQPGADGPLIAIAAWLEQQLQFTPQHHWPYP